LKGQISVNDVTVVDDDDDDDDDDENVVNVDEVVKCNDGPTVYTRL